MLQRFGFKKSCFAKKQKNNLDDFAGAEEIEHGYRLSKFEAHKTICHKNAIKF